MVSHLAIDAMQATPARDLRVVVLLDDFSGQWFPFVGPKAQSYFDLPNQVNQMFRQHPSLRRLSAFRQLQEVED